jgi:hypothetical protein
VQRARQTANSIGKRLNDKRYQETLFPPEFRDDPKKPYSSHRSKSQPN